MIRRKANKKEKSTLGLELVTAPTKKLLDEFAARTDAGEEKKHHKREEQTQRESTFNAASELL